MSAVDDQPTFSIYKKEKKRKKEQHQVSLNLEKKTNKQPK